MTEGRDLPNKEKMRTLVEKETYEYLGILEPDTIKQVAMREKNLKKAISEKTRKLHESKLWSSNLIKWIKTWLVSIVRYSGPLLKRTREELNKWTIEREN